MTLHEAYLETIQFFDHFDFIDSPRLDAEYLLLYLTGLTKADFIIKKREYTITGHQYRQLKKLVKKRVKGVSVAGLIHKKYFYDLEFYVNRNVLIPRPETELIIEILLNKFNVNNFYHILDIGTGSGCLAITSAKKFPQAQIDALDKSRKALKVAKINSHKNGINSRQIHFIHKSIFKFSPKRKYDIIISNPPYILSEDLNALYQTKSVCDPVISLNGGIDGLLFYRILKEFSDLFLKQGGWLIVEHGKGQQESIISIFGEKYSAEKYNDLSGIDRCLAFLKREGCD